MLKSEQATQRKRDAARAKKLAAQEQGTDGAQQRETAGAAERECGYHRYDELATAVHVNSKKVVTSRSSPWMRDLCK